MPYQDDFEDSRPGKLPKCFSDQGGVFEVAARPDGGKCLRQTVARRGIDWNRPTPDPYTMIGSTKWRDYEVCCDVYVERSGYASLFGRIVSSPQSAEPPLGYWIKVGTDGRWELGAGTKTLAAGNVSFAADRWHKLALKFAGPVIVADIDDVRVKVLEGATFGAGMAGVGSGWNCARFDNFAVRPLADAGGQSHVRQK
jgi:hypothetical protein